MNRSSAEPTNVAVADFDQWRTVARGLLNQQCHPADVRWIDRASGDTQQDLFGTQSPTIAAETPSQPVSQVPVPRQFIDLAKTVSHHRSSERWELLYRVLWRITHGERHLLELAPDPDTQLIRRMEKSIRRDAHKMKAFVRFRETADRDGELYVAWHRPDHRIVRLVAPFFASRFDVMRWAILTPDESAYWDGEKVHFGPGAPRSEAPTEDAMEELWKTYYGSIFNPARVKLKAMRAEMPRKFWSTLPEAELIDELTRAAPARVEAMVQKQIGGRGAEAFIPPEANSLTALRQAASICEGCDLFRNATQTVFGEGPSDARCVMVGEQPGDHEDRTGHPFVGPAGQLLDELMKEAGLDRNAIYVTNAVKHFKWQASGTRRLHAKPSSREVSACRPWVVHELELIKPEIVIALGATAAKSLFGPSFKITESRGQWLDFEHARHGIATFHPSAILRVPDEAKREEMRAALKQDLMTVAKHLK